MKKETKTPKKTFMARFRKWILGTSAILFVLCMGCVYFPSVRIFSGTAGKATGWGITRAISMLLMSFPEWVLCMLGVSALYLWYKHKLIMAVVYGCLIGGWLAL